MFSKLLVSALTLSAIVAMPAIAEPVTGTVSYADLNLSSPAGAIAFQHRIKAAIDRVCGNADPRDLRASAEVSNCRKAALASTNGQVARVTAKPGFTIASR